MKCLNNLVLFFLAVILLGCQSNNSTIDIKVNQDLIASISDLNHTIDLSEIQETPEDFMVIDIRDKSSFDLSHLEGAVHIPLPELIHSELIKSTNPEEKTSVIVGSGYPDAHAAWMVLKTMGIEDMYVLVDGETEEMVADIAAYDYKAMINKLLEEGMKANQSQPVKLPPKPKPRPIKKKVVEEEGC